MDRNAPAAIGAGIFISVIGVFALMIMPIVPGVLMAELGFSKEAATGVISAEVGGGALASIFAMFWIGKLNWRSTMLFAILVCSKHITCLLASFQECLMKRMCCIARFY